MKKTYNIYKVVIGKLLYKDKTIDITNSKIDVRTISTKTCIVFANDTYAFALFSNEKYYIPQNNETSNLNCMEYFVLKKELLNLRDLSILNRINLQRKVAKKQKKLFKKPRYL